MNSRLFKWYFFIAFFLYRWHTATVAVVANLWVCVSLCEILSRRDIKFIFTLIWMASLNRTAISLLFNNIFECCVFDSEENRSRNKLSVSIEASYLWENVIESNWMHEMNEEDKIWRRWRGNRSREKLKWN